MENILLPYVDQLPESGQQRIKWINNGEHLTAAETKFGNEGVLNQVGVQLQANIVAVTTAVNQTNIALESVQTTVSNIQEDLGGATGDLVQIVYKNQENIATLNQYAEDSTVIHNNITTQVDEIKLDLGRSYSPSKLTVQGEISLVKNILGQYKDENQNGEGFPGNPATGLKNAITTNASEIIKLRTDFGVLQDEFTEANIPGMRLSLDSIDSKLGTSQQEGTAFARIDSHDQELDSVRLDIQTLGDAIGISGGKLVERVQTLELSVQENTDNIQDAITHANNLDTLINDQDTGILKVQDNHTLEINELNTIVGLTAETGLQGKVSEINTVIGIGITPAPNGSVLNSVSQLNTAYNQIAPVVQNLQLEIGTENEGIKGLVNKHEDALYGTNASGSTLAELGVLAYIAKLEQRIFNLENPPAA